MFSDEIGYIIELKKREIVDAVSKCTAEILQINRFCLVKSRYIWLLIYSSIDFFIIEKKLLLDFIPVSMDMTGTVGIAEVDQGGIN